MEHRRVARAVRLAVIGGIGIIGGMAATFIFLFARRGALRWGATNQEAGESLPGDDLIAHANITATRAITICATANHVWPWIAQLGQGRGGLYSYDALENIIGCDIHSAHRIVPEWQNIGVGDEVRLHPNVALLVAALEPGRWLVIRGGVPVGDTPPPFDFTWAFVLHDQPDETIRLLVREHYAYTQWWAPFLIEPIAAISFVMSQKMLRGIRDRAERAAAREAILATLAMRPPDSRSRMQS